MCIKVRHMLGDSKTLLENRQGNIVKSAGRVQIPPHLSSSPRLTTRLYTKETSNCLSQYSWASHSTSTIEQRRGNPGGGKDLAVKTLGFIHTLLTLYKATLTKSLRKEKGSQLRVLNCPPPFGEESSSFRTKLH